MERDCKIRFRQSDLEIEIEGDREFVEAYFNKLLQEFQFTPFKTAERGNKVLDQLLAQKHPSSHSEKLLLFAYYLEKYSKLESFSADDISRCYQETRIPGPRNVNDLIRKLPREYVMEVGAKGKKKAWRLTRQGIEYVETKK